MIQAPDPPRVLYAVRPIAGAAAAMRVPRADQSAAAEALRQTLGPAGISSKAHARGYVAAAAATAGLLGIDLEYCAAERNIAAIARWLLGREARDAAAAYRAFTYREAYFKALGEWPDRRSLRFVADVDAPRFDAPGGLHVLHEAVAPQFVLTLVWSSDVTPVRAV